MNKWVHAGNAIIAAELSFIGAVTLAVGGKVLKDIHDVKKDNNAKTFGEAVSTMTLEKMKHRGVIAEDSEKDI